jgi:hypothetical protein
LSDEAKKAVGELVVVAGDALFGLPVLSGVRALVAPIVTRWRVRQLDAVVAAYVKQLAEVSGLPPEEVPATIERILQADKDGAAEAKVAEYFDLCLRAHSPEAWPYIARLAATYLHKDRKIDDFFRRCGRLLAACEGEDIAAIDRALRETVKKRAVATGDGARDIFWAAHDEVGIAVYAGEGRRSVSVSHGHLDRATSRNRQVIELLGTYRLGSSSGEGQVFFPHSDGLLDRLIDLFTHRPM